MRASSFLKAVTWGILSVRYSCAVKGRCDCKIWRLDLSVAEQLANCACYVVLLTYAIFFCCGSASTLCLLFAVSWVTRFWEIRDYSLFHFFIGPNTATHVQAAFLRMIKTSSTNVSPVCRTEVARK